MDLRKIKLSSLKDKLYGNTVEKKVVAKDEPESSVKKNKKKK